MAYLTAKTNGLDDLAAEILEAAGLSESDVDDVPSFGKTSLKPPPVVTSTTNINWPAVSAGENFFDKALANGNLEGGDDSHYANGADAGAAASALDAWAKEEEEQDDIDADDGGWELDADGEDIVGEDEEEAEVAAEDEDLGASATPGPDERKLWMNNSPFAADHVAAGSFDTAMQVRSLPDTRN